MNRVATWCSSYAYNYIVKDTLSESMITLPLHYIIILILALSLFTRQGYWFECTTVEITCGECMRFFFKLFPTFFITLIYFKYLSIICSIFDIIWLSFACFFCHSFFDECLSIHLLHCVALLLIYMFIHSFVRSFVRSFIHSFIYDFILHSFPRFLVMYSYIIFRMVIHHINPYFL